MRAAIDTDRCAGHGACVATCDEVFTLSDSGCAEVIADPIPLRLADSVREAADQCPEHAIRIAE